jgi:large subunit ribosomal protein L6
MDKELSKKIEIPEGIETEVSGAKVTVKGPKGINQRKFSLFGMTLEKKDSHILIRSKKTTKNEKRIMNTVATHLKNMVAGVSEKFEYKLKVCFTHFPITVEMKDDEAIIKNFLGEKVPRKVRMPAGADIRIDKDIITVTSTNIETAGQAAANFEAATKIPNRDRRIFQDGIFITNKCGVEI